jgi:hypothetical protein
MLQIFVIDWEDQAGEDQGQQAVEPEAPGEVRIETRSTSVKAYRLAVDCSDCMGIHDLWVFVEDILHLQNYL